MLEVYNFRKLISKSSSHFFVLESHKLSRVMQFFPYLGMKLLWSHQLCSGIG